MWQPEAVQLYNEALTEIWLHRKQKINDEGNLENIFSSFVRENSGFDLSWVSTLPSPISPLPQLATAESNSHEEKFAPKASYFSIPDKEI